jgi:hypothetical protein
VPHLPVRRTNQRRTRRSVYLIVADGGSPRTLCE